MRAAEPCLDVGGGARLRLEGRLAAGDPLVVDRSHTSRVADLGGAGLHQAKDRIAAMWDGLWTRLEGRIAVLEPLREEHREPLWEAAQDPRTWTWYRGDAAPRAWF